jgi:hypothetical protein
MGGYGWIWVDMGGYGWIWVDMGGYGYGSNRMDVGCTVDSSRVVSRLLLLLVRYED